MLAGLGIISAFVACITVVAGYVFTRGRQQAVLKALAAAAAARGGLQVLTKI